MSMPTHTSGCPDPRELPVLHWERHRSLDRSPTLPGRLSIRRSHDSVTQRWPDHTPCWADDHTSQCNHPTRRAFLRRNPSTKRLDLAAQTRSWGGDEGTQCAQTLLSLWRSLTRTQLRCTPLDDSLPDDKRPCFWVEVDAAVCSGSSRWLTPTSASLSSSRANE